MTAFGETEGAHIGEALGLYSGNANQPLARDFVYATLRTQFPCDVSGEQ